MLRDADMRRAGHSLAASFYIAMAAFFAMTALPVIDRYEARVFPVVEDFRITQWRNVAGGVLISGEMRKLRDCRFVELVFYAGDATDPQTPREMLFVEFLDGAPAGTATREPGRQPWGPWFVRAPKTAAGPDVFMRVTHRCHEAYDTHGVYLRASRESLFEHDRPR